MNKVAILMLLPVVAIGILGACTNEAEAPDSESIANASTAEVWLSPMPNTMALTGMAILTALTAIRVANMSEATAILRATNMPGMTAMPKATAISGGEHAGGDRDSGSNMPRATAIRATNMPGATAMPKAPRMMWMA